MTGIMPVAPRKEYLMTIYVMYKCNNYGRGLLRLNTYLPCYNRNSRSGKIYSSPAAIDNDTQPCHFFTDQNFDMYMYMYMCMCMYMCVCVCVCYVYVHAHTHAHAHAHAHVHVHVHVYVYVYVYVFPNRLPALCNRFVSFSAMTELSKYHFPGECC